MQSRSKLVLNLIKRKLLQEIYKILDIAKQGFDVGIVIEFKEIREFFITLLNKELENNSLKIHIFYDLEEIGRTSLNSEFSTRQSILFVGQEDLPCGLGFVNYTLPAPDYLLFSVPSAIEDILVYFRLDFYIDIFDGAKLTKLRQIAKQQGIGALIDAVIQTAYLAGFLGEGEKAQSYLDYLQDYMGRQEREDISLEKCATRYLSHVVSKGDAAHTYLKSCLSYFVVNQQGHTMTKASQVLSISRTTLQEHLKLANQLEVSRLFEGQCSFKN